MQRHFAFVFQTWAGNHDWAVEWETVHLWRPCPMFCSDIQISWLDSSSLIKQTAHLFGPLTLAFTQPRSSFRLFFFHRSNYRKYKPRRCAYIVNTIIEPLSFPSWRHIVTYYLNLPWLFTVDKKKRQAVQKEKQFLFCSKQEIIGKVGSWVAWRRGSWIVTFVVCWLNRVTKLIPLSACYRCAWELVAFVSWTNERQYEALTPSKQATIRQTTNRPTIRKKPWEHCQTLSTKTSSSFVASRKTRIVGLLVSFIFCSIFSFQGHQGAPSTAQKPGGKLLVFRKMNDNWWRRLALIVHYCTSQRNPSSRSK